MATKLDYYYPVPEKHPLEETMKEIARTADELNDYSAKVAAIDLYRAIQADKCTLAES